MCNQCVVSVLCVYLVCTLCVVCVCLCVCVSLFVCLLGVVVYTLIVWACHMSHAVVGVVGVLACMLPVVYYVI